MKDGSTVPNYTGKKGGATSHNTGYTATALRASAEIRHCRNKYKGCN